MTTRNFYRTFLLLCVLLLGGMPRRGEAQTFTLAKTQAPPATTMQSGATSNANGSTLTTVGYSSILLNVTGSMSGGTTLNFECSVDASTWVACTAWQIGTSTLSTTTTSTGDYAVNPGAYQNVRARISAYSSGTITVKGYLGVMNQYWPVSNSTVAQATGTNLHTVIDSGNVACSNCTGTGLAQTDQGTFTPGAATSFAQAGGFYQTTATANPLTDSQYGAFQVTAQRSLFTNIRNASGTEVGTAAVPFQVTLANTGANATAVKVDGSAVTQPISGSVACSNCTGTGLSQTDEATFTPGSANAFAQIGGFFQTTATNNALTNLQYGAAQMTATRAVFHNLRNAAGAEIGVAATPLQVSLANTAANATAVKIDGSAVTQPVSLATLPALVAGSAVIGHVIADTGSTTAVTQATGTNLHAVIDTGSTTAVTQATATNLNAAVVGTGTAGSPAGNILTVQGVASMTKLLVTPDSVALPANQSVNISQMNGATTTMGNGVSGTGVQRVTLASDSTGQVFVAKSSRTHNTPVAISVGTSSAQAFAANGSRTGLVMVNTSTNTVSCTGAATAVLNAGITLTPYGTWNMNSDTFTTGAIQCIASGAASNVSGQEIQ